MNILKLLAVTMFAGFLGACSTQTPQVITQTKYIVVMPPSNLLQCTRTRLPNTAKLTDVDVARLIQRFWRNEETCDANMKAIVRYLQEAQRRLELSN